MHACITTHLAIGVNLLREEHIAHCTIFNISLHIEFYEFNGNIFILWPSVSTDPQFNVISCCTGEVLCKPWRVVELTACAGGCTVLTIPENIIGKEYTNITAVPLRVNATLTEVIIANKCRDTIIITGYVTRALKKKMPRVIQFC